MTTARPHLALAGPAMLLLVIWIGGSRRWLVLTPEMASQPTLAAFQLHLISFHYM